VGAVYSGNTIGSIAGSFLGGFVMIPTLGIQKTVFVAAGVNVLAGVWMLLLVPGGHVARRRIAAATIVVLTALTFAVTPTWDPARLSFGPFVQAKKLSPNDTQSAVALARIARYDEVLYHKEGLSTTVTVKRTPGGVLGLYVNGKPDAHSHGELSQQRLLAHVPLLLHPGPRDVLEIGLASGMTLAAAGTHPVETLDCVEISLAVEEATRLFDAFNDGILDDDRVRVTFADGRNHLALSASSYDVIISQPSNLWIAGVADLFTQEFFGLCAARLRPGGVVCIWLETLNLDPASFRSVVRTFRSVFPETTIWNAMGSSDFMLVGGTAPLAMDAAAVTSRMTREPLASSLREIYIETVPDLLSHMVMGPAGAERLAGGAPIHTDDNAHLEFAAPRSQPKHGKWAAFLDLIEPHREADLSFLVSDAALREEAERMIRARGHLVKELQYADREQDRQAARAGYRRAAEVSPALPGVRKYARMNLFGAKRLAQSGDRRGALDLYRLLVATVPTDRVVRYRVGAFLLALGEHAAAVAQFDIAGRLPAPTAGRHDETPAALRAAITAARRAGRTDIANALRARGHTTE
jgi:spermidine synthase